MSTRSRTAWFRRAAQALALLLAIGVSSPALAGAIQATSEIPEEELLDVAIEVLDPGVPDPATTSPRKLEGVFPDLRRSEARFMPMPLMVSA